MKYILLVTLLFPSLIFAQKNYHYEFKKVINDIEKNYAGFQDKVENKKEYYNFFKKQLVEDSITNLDQLKGHVKTYLNFFEDLHLYQYKNYIDESVAAKKLNKYRDRIYQFKVLNNNTCYLKIGSFANSELVDSLINVSIDTISKSTNLIIDIRNNGGGGDAAFKSILPILATNDIFVKNVKFLATPQNWFFFKNTIKISIGTWNPKNEDKFIQAPWINDTSQLIRTLEYTGTNEYPKHIAVLVNRKVGSAGEQFVFCAKQSFKAKIFGENTGGFFDYSNCRHFEVIKDSLYISAPTTKVYGLPANQIDKHGIVPDFYLNQDNQIDQILRYFKNWN